MRNARLSDGLFALKLAGCVDPVGSGRIRLAVGRPRFSIKDIVSGIMDQGNLLLPAGRCQGRDCVGIDCEGRIDLGLCPVNLGISRRIDDEIRLNLPNRRCNGVGVQKVKGWGTASASGTDLTQTGERSFQFMRDLSALADQKDAHGLPDRQRLAAKGAEWETFSILG